MSSTLTAVYRRHEQEKCRAYEERVRAVEHGCFTPLVFSTSGGMEKAATVVCKHLPHLLSTFLPFSHGLATLHLEFFAAEIFHLMWLQIKLWAPCTSDPC